MDKVLEKIQAILDILPELVVVLDSDYNMIAQNGPTYHDLPLNLSHVIKTSFNSGHAEWIIIPTPTRNQLSLVAPVGNYFIVFFPDSFPEQEKTNIHTYKPKKDNNDTSVDIVYTSQAMQETVNLSMKAARVDANVLFSGETGVGKTLLAKYIHNQSMRREGPFVAINCGAIPATLLEAELFGYEKGAFTGADKAGKVGLLETGIDGTVFLDEIGELPKDLQVKILTAIDEKKIIRVGGRRPIDLDIRLIAATNKDLYKMVMEGDFREDLYYRLNVFSITIPPLRSRLDDIYYLAKYFLDKYNFKYNTSKSIDSEVLSLLTQYNWPGNIRELQNAVERMVVISETNVITKKDLPQNFLHSTKNYVSNQIMDGVTLQSEMDILERALIQKALAENKSIRKAAASLGISHVTLLRKMEKFHMNYKNISTQNDNLGI